VVVAIDSVGVLVMAMAGYAFAKLAFHGKRLMFGLIALFN
jgi:ABC-type glycerol-3-phosphate transport system permease component